MKGVDNLTQRTQEYVSDTFDEPAEPAAALASYLDDLLRVATHGAAQEGQRQPEVLAPVVEAVAKVEVPVPVPVSVPAQSVPAADGSAPVGKPGWSEQPFECLIFKVAGLQLAVPLVLLGAIHRLDERVTPIPGSPSWYMGMLPGSPRQLRVVDTAQWVMAGRVPAQARENYRFVIRLDNSEWALACDEVAQSFTLQPDQVKWRTARSLRPWLAGTVVSHMCALLDVGTMAALLGRAEKEQHLCLV